MLSWIPMWAYILGGVTFLALAYVQLFTQKYNRNMRMMLVVLAAGVAAFIMLLINNIDVIWDLQRAGRENSPIPIQIIDDDD